MKEENAYLNLYEKIHLEKLAYRSNISVFFHKAQHTIFLDTQDVAKIVAFLANKYYFPNIKTRVKICSEDCMNCQNNESMTKSLAPPEQSFLETPERTKQGYLQKNRQSRPIENREIPIW